MTKFTRPDFKNLLRSRRELFSRPFDCGVAVYFCSSAESANFCQPDARWIQPPPFASSPAPRWDLLILCRSYKLKIATLPHVVALLRS